MGPFHNTLLGKTKTVFSSLASNKGFGRHMIFSANRLQIPDQKESVDYKFIDVFIERCL